MGVTWLDVDDTMRCTYGNAKQSVGCGYNKVRGLNALLAIASPRAGKFLADATAATRRTGDTATIICARLDLAFNNHSVLAVVLAASARIPITARMGRPSPPQSG